MRAEGLKVNANKCSCGLKEIPYLGYVITREGVKLDLKKVQGIMYLGQQTTTTEARVIIGMMHYYRYICTRRPYLLAPLTEAARGPKVKNCGMML